MAPSRKSTKPATLDDLIVRDDRDRLELVNGEIVEKAAPSRTHAHTETKVGEIVGPFNRKPGPKGPGGWFISTEIHVAYASGELYCHDVAGWRRERLPEGNVWPERVRPDWVCEIVSQSHGKNDHLIKPRVLHLAEVPHYWLLYPEDQVLLVHRWSADGYVVIQRAVAGETIRAAPFDAIEIEVNELFGVEE